MIGKRTWFFDTDKKIDCVVNPADKQIVAGFHEAGVSVFHDETLAKATEELNDVIKKIPKYILARML